MLPAASLYACSATVACFVDLERTNKICCVTGCNMCLDSDFFDLWRSCGDCEVALLEPECQLSCSYCIAGEGIDTAELPAPRADQQLAIPAAGCSVDRRDFELECESLSEGNCGKVWPTALRSPGFHLLHWRPACCRVILIQT